MDGWTDDDRTVRLRVPVLAAAMLVVTGAAAQAQESWATRLGIDSLRFSGLGAQIGVVRPVRIETATSYSLHADYGEISPRWRVVFTATFWESQFQDRWVRVFADSLKQVVVDPSGDDIVELGDIRVSDIALSAELRRVYRAAPWLLPYASGGVTAHVVNADGRLINGTFIERALDNIAVGLSALGGIDVRVRHIAVGVQARYDLLSLARYGSLRFGASYFFDLADRPGGRR